MSLLRVPRVTLPRLVSTGRWFSSEVEHSIHFWIVYSIKHPTGSYSHKSMYSHLLCKWRTSYWSHVPVILWLYSCRYSTTFADAICRWNNMKGFSSYLTTGTDEHGQKVQKEAIKRKMDVRAYCDSVASSFKNELNHYSLNIGRFIRTTDPDHVQVGLM